MARSRSISVNCRNRCGIRAFQRGGIGAQACASRDVEQRVVFALRIRDYQLYEELDVCFVRRGRIVGGCVHLDDPAPSSGHRAWPVIGPSRVDVGNGLEPYKRL